jgi:hypothetical protein
MPRGPAINVRPEMLIAGRVTSHWLVVETRRTTVCALRAKFALPEKPEH